MTTKMDIMVGAPLVEAGNKPTPGDETVRISPSTSARSIPPRMACCG